MRTLLPVAMLLVLCSLGSAWSATYYVAPGGLDTNSGSSGSPWATIQNFGNFAQAGDTLIIRAGTYSGAIFGWDGPNQGSYSQISGTAAQPILIEADPAAAAGSVIVNSRNNKNPVGFDLEPGCDYVNIVGLKIIDPNQVITKAGLEVAGSKGNQVLNNIIDGVGGVGGILIDTSNGVLVQGNTCIHVRGTGTTGHGMYLSGSSINCIIRGNSIHDNDFVGLHINGDLSEGSPGVVTNALIEDNYIYSNGQNAINADGLQSSIIRNNLMYNYARSGIVLYQIDASGPGTNNIIVNNTIAMPQSGAEAAIRFVNASTGNHVFNNVLLGAGNVFLDTSADSLPGLISDYNAVSPDYENDDTSGTITLAQWRTQTGNDTHSFTTTPSALFVSTTSSDYHLLSTSPAIDAGTPSLSASNAPVNDLDGNSRPSGAGYDIGCYEFQASGTPPAITTTSPLTQGTANAAYSTTFAASGGSAPYTFTVTVGSPPSGLTLSSAGVLSGTPTASGTSTFTVQVTDHANATASKQFQLVINPALSITTTTLAAGSVGLAYNQTLALSGGTSQFTWSNTGSLPAGLSLNSNTGAITGTPTVSFSSSITFKVTDAAGASATKALTLTINAGLSITSSSPLPGGIVGAAYSQSFATSGGTPSFTWTTTTGTVPPGLSLSSAGVLSGTPSSAGTFNFTVQVSDSASHTASKSFALTVTTVTISTASPLPVGIVGAAYSTTLSETSGTSPYTWSVVSGAPPGLTLSSGGVLSGTPTSAGTFSVTIQVSDANHVAASKVFALTINSQSVLTSIVVTPSSATVKRGATQAFSASALDQSGNVLSPQPAFTWSVSGGGTIDASGVFTAITGGKFTVTATNAGVSGTASVRVNAAPTVTSPPSSTNSQITVGELANFSVNAVDPNGGTVNYVWDFGDGTSATGSDVSHTYTISGNYTVTVTISDTSGDTTIATLPVTAAAGATPPPIPMTVMKLSGSVKFKAIGHDAFSIQGILPGLPAGLTLSGQIVALNLSGATVTFTLDKNGHARNANGVFAIKLSTQRSARTHKKTSVAGNANFTASLHNGAWATAWGFDPNVSAHNLSVPMTATIQFNDSVFAQTVNVTYSAKAHVGGSYKH